jgi:hypothetical protein
MPKAQVLPKVVVALLAAALSSGAAAAAQGISNLVVSGNQVTATIDLLGISADLTLTFEQVVGLTAANLGLSAQLVNPADSAYAGLLARFPAPPATPAPSGQIALPAAFPVVVRVQPPASGGLSFSGIQMLDIHTHNLELTANCPLRLFSAPAGGSFHDITTSMGIGSYRVRGSGGSFSEFVIVADTRPLASVVNQKFDALGQLLSTHGDAIPAPLLDDLTHQLQAARAFYQAGDNVNAAKAVAGFSDTVRRNSGTAIPDVWRASGDLPNVAGRLRAAAGTLSFSLSLAPAAL